MGAMQKQNRDISPREIEELRTKIALAYCAKDITVALIEAGVIKGAPQSRDMFVQCIADSTEQLLAATAPEDESEQMTQHVYGDGSQIHVHGDHNSQAMLVWSGKGLGGEPGK